MALSKSLLFALLLAVCMISLSSALPLSDSLRQTQDDSTDEGPDDELTSMPSESPEMTAEPSTAPTGTTTGTTGPTTVDDGEEGTATSEPSEEPSTAPEEDDEVCVDASYLSHLPAHQLVHTESFPASVLCPKDSSLPCATAQHLVRYNGKALSYAGYCDLVECEKKDNVLVNSVLSHKWVDEAHHDNTVHLTMFDARHPETTQKLLHRFIEFKRKFI